MLYGGVNSGTSLFLHPEIRTPLYIVEHLPPEIGHLFIKGHLAMSDCVLELHLLKGDHPSDHNLSLEVPLYSLCLHHTDGTPAEKNHLCVPQISSFPNAVHKNEETGKHK